jgi:hypothetical protein
MTPIARSAGTDAATSDNWLKRRFEVTYIIIIAPTE